MAQNLARTASSVRKSWGSREVFVPDFCERNGVASGNPACREFYCISPFGVIPWNRTANGALNWRGRSRTMRAAFLHLLIKQQPLKQLLEEITIIQGKEQIGSCREKLQPFPKVECARPGAFGFGGLGFWFGVSLLIFVFPENGNTTNLLCSVEKSTAHQGCAEMLCLSLSNEKSRKIFVDQEGCCLMGFNFSLGL